jgi:serine/threonine protein kinase
MRLISALKNLQHPNIVKILDIDFRKLDAAGYPVRLWIVMEFVDQRPDWDAFERTVPAADVRPIIRQVLSGLAYSHAHQIVYRMLCPRSILLDHDGKVKLTRFSGCRSIDVLNPAYTPEVFLLWINYLA